jgi:hypothetical protein
MYRNAQRKWEIGGFHGDGVLMYTAGKRSANAGTHMMITIHCTEVAKRVVVHIFRAIFYAFLVTATGKNMKPFSKVKTKESLPVLPLAMHFDLWLISLIFMPPCLEEALQHPRNYTPED